MTTVNSVGINDVELLKKNAQAAVQNSQDISINFNSDSASNLPIDDFITEEIEKSKVESMVSSLINDAKNMGEDPSEGSLEMLKARLANLQSMSTKSVDVATILNDKIAELPKEIQKKVCSALGVSEPKAKSNDNTNYNFSPVTPFQKALGSMPQPVQNVVNKTTNYINSTASDKSVGEVSATENGNKLAQIANQTAKQMGSSGWCLKGVNNSLEKMYGFRLSYNSAYMAIPALDKMTDKFTKVNATKADLDKLPAGAVVVWEADGDNPHGHISISLGNGYEASDHVAKQYKNISEKFHVYIPN